MTFEYREGVNLPIVMHRPDGDVLHKKLSYACPLNKNHHKLIYYVSITAYIGKRTVFSI